MERKRVGTGLHECMHEEQGLPAADVERHQHSEAAPEAAVAATVPRVGDQGGRLPQLDVDRH